MKWDIWLSDTHGNVHVLKFRSREEAEVFYAFNAHLDLTRDYK